MYHTIYLLDIQNKKKISEGAVLYSADSYFIFCLKKLNYVNFMTLEELIENKFNCNNLLISGSRYYNKFINYLNIKDIKLSKNVNIFILKTGGIHGKILHTNLNINIISTYSYALNLYYNNYYKNFWFPHMIRYKVNFNSNPINKILISGAITSKKNKRLNISTYPNREMMIEKSKNNKYLEYFPRQKVSKKNINENHIFGKKYIELLNKYKVCFTDDATKTRPYIVAKFFEIMSSGSLLLSINPNTKKYFEKLGFIDKIHYISATVENIDEKIKYIFDDKNKDLINTIRKNGYEKVYKYHTIDCRTTQLNKILNEKLEDFTLCKDGIAGSEYYIYK